MKKVRNLLNTLATICHNSNYAMAYELRKNKYSESDNISENDWITIGINAGVKKLTLTEVWSLN